MVRLASRRAVPLAEPARMSRYRGIYTVVDFDIFAQMPDKAAATLNNMRDIIHQRNVDAGWWNDLVTGEKLDRNVPELLALIHSEVSEGLEGYRKSLMDDHLPHRPMLEVEMADTIVRIFDLCGGLGLDIGGALVEKLAYNAQRQDHKREARLGANGKKI
jgi:hypothetical protein